MTSLRALVVLLPFLLPVTALAQKPPLGAPTPYEAQPTIVVSPPTQTPPPGSSPLQARAPHRARLAIEGGVGGVLGDSEGGALNLSVQIGYQASDIWAVYYQTGLALNGWARTGEDDSFDAYAFSPNLAMVDVTLGRAFQFGFGAGVDVGSFGVCDENDCRMERGQAQPATESRVAVIIPLPGVRARWGIPISLHFHTTYFEDSQMHTMTLNTGLMRF